MSGQRGFTLVELVVAAGIVAMLAVVAALSLAVRPGALRATVGSFDASFATARAIAATSGNGATVVVAPRSDSRGNRLPGFVLRIYSGRPTAANAVTLADAPALVADADVREATLGTPPFAIFLSSAGNASGLASYPRFASDGAAQFAPLAAQPACPAGGLRLAFSSARASQTRVLPCGARAFGSPVPMATESPAPVLLTPKALVYYWPTAPVQTFVATEWGYTRWFAAGAFVCGASVAAFPQSNPAPPYSLPHAPEDASADPLAPAGVPVSYADAPDSMQDAPARFPLVPQTAGVCTATVADAHGQSDAIGVNVMGPLTAAPSALAWAATDSSARTVSLGKSYDLHAVNLGVDASACAGIVTVGVNGTTVPTQLDGTSSIRYVQVTPVQTGGRNAGGSCNVRFASQYAGEPPAQVTINVTAGAVAAMQTWPALVRYGLSGGSFPVALVRREWNVARALNAMLGGAVANAAGTCTTAQALKADGTPDLAPPPWTGVSTDGNGCYGGGVYTHEPSGVARTFSANLSLCNLNVMQQSPSGWTANPAVSAGLALLPGSTAGQCNIPLNDSANSGTNAYYAGLATAQVIGCSGSTGFLPMGASCVTAFIDQDFEEQICEPSGGGFNGGTTTIVNYAATNATLDTGSGLLTRTAPGTITVTETGSQTIGQVKTGRFGVQTCTPKTINYNRVVATIS